MNEQMAQFLNLRTKPARLGAQEVAWHLGFSPHEIPILMAGKMLKPLGHPPANGTKYFALVVLEGLAKDVKWLARASDVVVEHWRFRNQRQKSAPSLPAAD